MLADLGDDADLRSDWDSAGRVLLVVFLDVYLQGRGRLAGAFFTIFNVAGICIILTI
jgi:hypothetical protein